MLQNINISGDRHIRFIYIKLKLKRDMTVSFNDLTPVFKTLFAVVVLYLPFNYFNTLSTHLLQTWCLATFLFIWCRLFSINQYTLYRFDSSKKKK